ncbi:MAG: type II toxin-antitoxin system VapC family toxin [Methanocellales archaeon]|nr:type II toxin-antitoxin system VapC family toxin [Methanocellales archaeon]
MIVLDTNVFSNDKFCRWLKGKNLNPLISSITYTELLYHHLKKGKDESFTDGFLQALGVTVVPYDMEHAKIACRKVIGKWDFKRNIRDYMIGSSAIKDDCCFVTSNVKDFEWVDKVYAPEEFMSHYEG